MAHKGRFTQARIYVAGSSIALLLGVWGLLASQDARSRDAYLSTTNDSGDASVAAITGSSQSDDDDDDDEEESEDRDDDDDDGGTTAVTPAPTQAPQAHSRTSGS